MKMAEIIAERSTCTRLKVGAVLAHDSRVISTGYNGPPSGMPHCDHEAGNDEPCRDAVHAETNALLFAGRYGVPTVGTELFVTHMPCVSCAQLIITAGVEKVYYLNSYRIIDGVELLFRGGVSVGKLDL